MVVWILLPMSLSLVSFIGTWTVYGLAFSNDHVCSLSDWETDKYCTLGTSGCCSVPTISASGTLPPENSLFTATINSAAFLFLIFSIFHHAHVIEKHACHSMLSKVALAFGVVSSLAAFAGGNCNPRHLTLLHSLGAAISFTCICFYTVLLTVLTGKCALTGYEKILFPLRIVLSVLQTIATICYTIFFTQKEHFYVHVSAIFEWILSCNLELFELSYVVEFWFFSSFMISNLLSKRGEEKPLLMTVS